MTQVAVIIVAILIYIHIEGEIVLSKSDGLQNKGKKSQLDLEERIQGGENVSSAVLYHNIVVTAAHCVNNFEKMPEKVEVLAGFWNRQIPPDQVRNGKRILIHRCFKTPYYYDDIAVICLNSRLLYNENVNKIDMLEKKNKVILKGTNVSIAGFGGLSPFEPAPAVLQMVNLTVESNTFCRHVFPDYTSITMTCAGTNEKGPRHGDSGGGLVTRRNGKNVLIGVWAFGIFNNATNISGPGFFMKIAGYRERFLDGAFKECHVPV